MAGMKKNCLCRAIVIFKLLVFSVVAFTVTEGGFAQDKVLILRYTGKAFDDAVRGITDESGGDFTIIDKTLTKEISDDEFAQIINSENPDLIVLMENRAIYRYQTYLETKSDSLEVKPRLSLMALYLDIIIAGMENSAGIRYEIPLVTSAIRLRSISKVPIKKIGVIYREIIEDYIQENRAFVEAENMELVGVRLPNIKENKPREVKAALKKLLEKEKVDAVWVLNDNILLNREILTQAWIPAVSRYKKPMLVGLELLVQNNINFGTMAVLPDHYLLGLQAADIIFDIFDEGGTAKGAIEYPVSIMGASQQSSGDKDYNENQRLTLTRKIFVASVANNRSISLRKENSPRLSSPVRS